MQLQELGAGAGSRPPDGRLSQAQHGIQVIAVTRCRRQPMRCSNRVNGAVRLALIEPGVDRELVVLADKHNRQLVQGRKIERFVDHAFFEAPIAKKDHRDLGLALKARGPSRAHSQGHCATNNGGGAHEADVQVNQVHGAAAPATATGSPAVELGQHGFEAAALG